MYREPFHSELGCSKSGVLKIKSESGATWGMARSTLALPIQISNSAPFGLRDQSIIQGITVGTPDRRQFLNFLKPSLRFQSNGLIGQGVECENRPRKIITRMMENFS